MLTLPIVFSLLYMVAFTIYFFLAIYILFLNTKQNIKRLFLTLCGTLCVWALCYAISISAPNYCTALLWRKVGAIGWGSTNAVLLHYLLILTEKKDLLKKKWFPKLIYVPAILTILVYGPMTPWDTQYALIYSSSGWVSMTTSSLVNFFFMLYYFGYTLINLGLLVHWGHNSTELKKKKQAKVLTITMLVAFTAGPLNDIATSQILLKDVQQVGLLFFLVPVGGIFYAIKKYDFLNTVLDDTTTSELWILSETNRKTIYLSISLSVMIGSIFYFTLRYFLYGEQLVSSLLYSAFLLLYALFLYGLFLFPIKKETQDTIFICMVGFVIPLLSYRLVDESACTTIWAVSFILLILSIAFQKKRLLVIISIIALTTEVIVWIRVPNLVVTVDATDHMARIALLCLAIYLSYYINKIYVARVLENEYQTQTQQLISQISAGFMTVTTENQDSRINSMLKQLGEFFCVNRTYLCLRSEDGASITDTYEWLPNKLLTNTKDIQPLLSVPIMCKGKNIGFIGFDGITKAKQWNESDQDFLRIISNLLSDALTKVNSEKELNYMAYYDKLTGLPNHSLFKKRLEKEISLVLHSNKLIGVLFLNLDYFKTVNDTMGHEGGDNLLRLVAERLNLQLEAPESVCRFGGDEFLIMLPQMETEVNIQTAVKNVMSIFEEPMRINDQEYFVSASGGVSVFPMDGLEIESLIKNADLALHASKESGKKQVTFCNHLLKKEVEDKTQLTNYLHRAQERNELILYYQPQVNIFTNRIVGAEALIRWKHPEKGLILPSSFIPLAEQTGLINPIGQWALETACSQAKEWQEKGLPPLVMAVNMSVAQFQNPNLKQMVAHTLERTGLSGEYLELEITENISIRARNEIVNMLNDLKTLGLSISIDDFGTEYSSLTRLKYLPIDRIKIAMQFIHGISNSSKDEAITEVIINLANSLGLRVIAEGVETETQLAFLAERFCDEVQGYFYYKPLTALEFEEVLYGNLSQSKL